MVRAFLKTLATLCLLTTGGLFGADPVLEQVAKDWTARQQIAETVRYELEGTKLDPKGTYNIVRRDVGITDPDEDLPEEDRVSPYNVLLTVHFGEEKNWMRVERERDILSPGPEFIRQFTIDVSNGEEFQRYFPLERNPRIAELKEAGKRMQFELTELNSTSAYIMFREFAERPLYWAHGLVPFSGPMDGLREPVDLTGWQVAGRAVQDGRECVILRTPTRFDGTVYSEIWVDPDRGSAVMRFGGFSKGHERTTYIVAYQETPHGWLPESWSVEQQARTNDGKSTLRDRTEMRVIGLEMNPPLDRADFHFEPTPGMYVKDVQDKRNPTRTIHVGAGQKPQDAVAEWRRLHGNSEPPASSWSRAFFWIGVGALGIVLLAYGIRRYRAT